MSKQKKEAPHVVAAQRSGDISGAHDVPLKHKDDQSAGHHSGRPVPKATPHRDLDKVGDFAAGAANGGDLGGSYPTRVPSAADYPQRNKKK